MFAGLTFNHWHTSEDDGIVTLQLQHRDKSINVLSRRVLRELDAILERIEMDPPAGVVILSGKSNGFIAGADIHEFIDYARHQRVYEHIRFGQRVFTRLAHLPCPSVAAIDGTCLGGGLELALACTWRVATERATTRFGFPEVMLGIHPGWGGTARLPDRIGALHALPLMLKGKPIDAHTARSWGLVDKLCPTDALRTTARACLQQPPQNQPLRWLLATISNMWLSRLLLAPLLRRQTRAQINPAHYPAPFAIIDVWRKRSRSMPQRLQQEAQSVAKLGATAQARQLIRVFMLRERIRKEAGDVDANIRRVHVVGAGTMGADIAAWCAWRGFDVSVGDKAPQALTTAHQRATTLFARKAHGNKERQARAAARLQFTTDDDVIRESDLVLEAIIEDAASKQALYAALEPALKSQALLVSNTSSLDPAVLSQNLAHPEHFAGLHFFNPVAGMPLIEIVMHDHVDPLSIKRLQALVKKLGKLGIRVKGSPGFLVNRILMPYLLEAITLLGEGVPGAAIDRAATDFGMPVGPIELADRVGLDICIAVGDVLAPFLDLELPAALRQHKEPGRRGKKDGQGLYRWPDGKVQKPHVNKVYQPPEDLLDRLLGALLNEAVACLHEGVVDDADLLDAGIIFGTGFAPFRGGPMQYIRSTGKERQLAMLAALEAKHGQRFAAKPGWDHPALTGE